METTQAKAEREAAKIAARFLRANLEDLRHIAEAAPEDDGMRLMVAAYRDLAAELEVRADGGPRCQVCAQQAKEIEAAARAEDDGECPACGEGTL